MIITVASFFLFPSLLNTPFSNHFYSLTLSLFLCFSIFQINVTHWIITEASFFLFPSLYFSIFQVYVTDEMPIVLQNLSLNFLLDKIPPFKTILFFVSLFFYLSFSSICYRWYAHCTAASFFKISF